MYAQSRKTVSILIAILLLGVLAGCGNFYSSTGSTGTTGTGTPTGSLPGNLQSGYPKENDTVGTNPTLTYTFDRTVNPGTITTNTVEIFDSSGNKLPDYDVTVESGEITITITGLTLPLDQNFYIVLSSAIQYSDSTSIGSDLTINFNTGTGTSTGLNLVTHWPGDGETGVGLSPTFSFTFNNTLDTSSITTSTVSIYNTSMSYSVTGYSITYENSQTKMNITGLALSPNQNYQINLTAGIRDVNGNYLPADITINFDTYSSGGDTTPPGSITPLFVTSSNNGVIFEWLDPVDTDGDLSHIIVSNISDYTWQTVPIGTQRIHLNSSYGDVYIFAVDTSGNESTYVHMNGMARTASEEIYFSPINGLSEMRFSYMHPVNSFPTSTSDISAGGSINHPFSISRREVSYSNWHFILNWAKNNGYSFASDGTEGSNGPYGGPPLTMGKPVANVDFRSVVIWCNALTQYHNEKNGTLLKFAYVTSSGNPIMAPSDISGLADFFANYRHHASGFRLPTVLEWEAAARYNGTTGTGITESGFHWTPGSHASGNDYDVWDASTATYAWYGISHVTNSGMKAPNRMAMYDVSGNAREWCIDPMYTTGQRLRGGSAKQADATFLQIGSMQNQGWDGSTGDDIGFRLARTEYYWRHD